MTKSDLFVANSPEELNKILYEFFKNDYLEIITVNFLPPEPELAWLQSTNYPQQPMNYTILRYKAIVISRSKEIDEK